MAQKVTMEKLGNKIAKRATEFGGIGALIGDAIGTGTDTVANFAPPTLSLGIKTIGKLAKLSGKAIGTIVGATAGAVYGTIETFVDK